ncbi:MAG: hypothetical protein J5554_09770, partial [Paludibacteraceae bacterium]|nr:hypothetical protein [Paludibacteraceae bacterium]
MKAFFFYCIIFFSFSLCNADLCAGPETIFRIENDTVLHICSNNIDYWLVDGEPIRGEWGDVDGRFPFGAYSTIVVDEGVDSVSFPLTDSNRLLSLPSTLRYLDVYDVSRYGNSAYLQDLSLVLPFEGEYDPSLSSRCEIRLHPDNPYFCMEDCALYDRRKTKLYLASFCKENSVFQLPATVVSILNFRNTHFSKIIFPAGLKSCPYYALNCDTLIVQSSGFELSWLMDAALSSTQFYFSSDSLLVSTLLCENEKLMDRRIVARKNIHCPGYDVRKRDTSWMRKAYHPIFVTEQGDSLKGIDSIDREVVIQSVIVDGIPKENLRIHMDDIDDAYQFFVATYDTLYRLPFQLRFVDSPIAGPKISDYGELVDSVFSIREGVDTLPYLEDKPVSFKKVVIPKSMRYLKGTLRCDSVFIYSDSLNGALGDVCDLIRARYYHVENEQLYLALRLWYSTHKSADFGCWSGDGRVEIYSPNADIRNRMMALQWNMDPPVWRDWGGNRDDLTFRPTHNRFRTLRMEIDGISSSDLYVFSTGKNGRKMMERQEREGDVYWWFSLESGDTDWEYAAWTYDTLLHLSQKSQIRVLKQDGSLWTEGFERKELCLFYLPEGETGESLLESGKKIQVWKSGDTIPSRYLNRLAIGLLYENGECLPVYGIVSCRLFWRNNQNYLNSIRTSFYNPPISIPAHSEELWMNHVSHRPSPTSIL